MIEFKAFGIKISFDFSFFATLALLMLLKDTKYIILGFYACMLHEIGHLILMNLAGGKLEKISFYGAGIKIVPAHKIMPFFKDILILLGGPLANFIAFSVAFLLSFKNNDILIFAFMNLTVGIFNLLPFKAFDGGRILALIFGNFLSIQNANKAAMILKILCVFLIGIFFCFFIINKSGNITLYLTVLYFLVCEIFA